MFLDASVILALLLNEPEEEEIFETLSRQPRLTTSPLAIFEASSRLVRFGATFSEAFDTVCNYILSLDGEVIALDLAEGRAAHACASRYHHLTGHPARLNMGDCFAYAAATTSGLRLAYKGNDFVHTDIDGVRFGP